jgi:hypothetical protein
VCPVVYAVSSDGMLHVMGLPSGKDMQRPARFLPANARWTDAVAVGTTLYAATTGTCGGAPNGVWAIDLDSDTKPVVSWNTQGGGIVGAVAFTTDGTLVATVGAGRAASGGYANAVVALDPKTLALRDWFAFAGSDLATGPTVFRHGDREIIAVGTRDGRVVLLDAARLGGADHRTPLLTSGPSWPEVRLAEALATGRGDLVCVTPPPSRARGAAVVAATARRCVPESLKPCPSRTPPPTRPARRMAPSARAACSR